MLLGEMKLRIIALESMGVNALHQVSHMIKEQTVARNRKVQ